MRITPRLRPIRVTATLPVGVRGRVHVAKIGRDGQRVPVRVDRNKRAWQRVWDHVQDNLITNGGLDYGMSGTGLSTDGFRFYNLTNYVHVGTGNTTPAVGDSALVAEVARTNATLDLGTAGQGTLPSTGVGQFRRVRTFDYDEANANLAEFGGGADDSATVLTRGLFEDEGGSPTPITKTSDELLIVTYDLLSNVSPTTVTSAGTLTITGYDTFDISSIAYEAAAGAATDGPYFQGIWNSSPRIIPVTSFQTAYAGLRGDRGVGVPTQGLGAFESYTGGSYERTVTAEYGPQVSGAELVGYEVGTPVQSIGWGMLFGFRFDDPAVLSKDKDYRVTLSAKISVARS